MDGDNVITIPKKLIHPTVGGMFFYRESDLDLVIIEAEWDQIEAYGKYA